MLDKMQFININSRIKRLQLSLTAYFCGVIVYGSAIALYALNPYYQNFISRKSIDIALLPEIAQPFLRAFFFIIGWSPWEVICNLFMVYIVVSLFLCLFSKSNITRERPYIFIRGIIAVAKQFPAYLSNLGKNTPVSINISSEEKTTALFFLVKLIYLPIMLNFAFDNLGAVITDINNISLPGLTLELGTRYGYFLLFNILFMIDTFFFTFGYMFESRSLNNEVRSVEPTMLGWLAALVCYPPLIQITLLFIPWGSTDLATFANPYLTIVMSFLSICCISFFLWATISLGAKCSNLTNRGIVTNGAYGIVRHPAYISKNLSWLLMAIPLIIINFTSLILVLGWMGIYLLRAITEERHLSRDPEYLEYCKKVRYRFIPGIY